MMQSVERQYSSKPCQHYYWLISSHTTHLRCVRDIFYKEKKKAAAAAEASQAIQMSLFTALDWFIVYTLLDVRKKKNNE